MTNRSIDSTSPDPQLSDLRSPGSLSNASLPPVTLVMPMRNEEDFIGECLESLLRQDYPNICEIIVADGKSTDATAEIAAKWGGPVRVVDNPGVTRAAALNVGLAAARGEILCCVDAHTGYADDYVRRCVEVLIDSGADNVGGRMRPVGTTPFGRAVAAVMQSPFGIGPGRFHYAEERMDVETVYLGCWWRRTLEELGGWDATGIHSAAEDDELNYRIRQGGGRIVLDPSIRSVYTPRQTPRRLWRQYQSYGLAKTSTLAKHRTLPYWRPLVPVAFVSTVALGAVAPIRWPLKVAVPAVHLAFCAVVGMKLARDEDVDFARTVVAIEICHWSYGLGFLGGVARLASGRGFDGSPSNRW